MGKRGRQERVLDWRMGIKEVGKRRAGSKDRMNQRKIKRKVTDDRLTFVQQLTLQQS